MSPGDATALVAALAALAFAVTLALQSLWRRLRHPARHAAPPPQPPGPPPEPADPDAPPAYADGLHLAPRRGEEPSPAELTIYDVPLPLRIGPGVPAAGPWLPGCAGDSEPLPPEYDPLIVQNPETSRQGESQP